METEVLQSCMFFKKGPIPHLPHPIKFVRYKQLKLNYTPNQPPYTTDTSDVLQDYNGTTAIQGITWAEICKMAHSPSWIQVPMDSQKTGLRMARALGSLSLSLSRQFLVLFLFMPPQYVFSSRLAGLLTWQLGAPRRTKIEASSTS